MKVCINILSKLCVSHKLNLALARAFGDACVVTVYYAVVKNYSLHNNRPTTILSETFGAVLVISSANVLLFWKFSHIGLYVMRCYFSDK